MRNWALVASTSVLLAACGNAIPAPRAAPVPIDRPAAAVPASRPALSPKGLEAVMGKDRATLIRMFGQPRLDVVEVQGRKLQFSGRACILDAYLYPDGRGGAEVVTHVDARRSDGAEVDRVQCVNALTAR